MSFYQNVHVLSAFGYKATRGYTKQHRSFWLHSERCLITGSHCRTEWCIPYKLFRLVCISHLGQPSNAEASSCSLDRTNFVQDILSRTSLEQHLFLVRREWIGSGSLWTNHRELWAENGDALSRIYAGTGALNTSFTRSGKRTFGGTLDFQRVECSFMASLPRDAV